VQGPQDLVAAIVVLDEEEHGLQHHLNPRPAFFF